MLNVDVESEQKMVAYFYIDETYIETENRKHVAVDAIFPKNPMEAALEMVKVKAELGFAPLDEVKLNTSGLKIDSKIKLTDGVLNILVDCIAFISIVEGEDKQKAAEASAMQVFDYCVQNNIEAFVLYFDKDLVPRTRDFEKFARARFAERSTCIGIHHLNSSGDQLIQCCDVFLGLYRLSMEVEFGSRIITRKIYRQEHEVEEEWNLSDYVVLSMRGQLWGEQKRVKVYEEPEYEDTFLPYHCSLNLGFRIDSNISQETRQLLEDKLATVYMGCLS